MGWRGVLRAASADLRRWERENERVEKQAKKEAAAADAADAVNDWEERVEALQRVHTNRSQRIDWWRIRDQPEPSAPNDVTQRQDEIETRLARLPSIFDFMHGGSRRRCESLERKHLIAAANDRDETAALQLEYNKAMQEWRDERAFAQRLIDGDPGAVGEVVTEYQSLFDDDLVGSFLNIKMQQGQVRATVHVHDISIVPDFRRKQLASGRLSETKMPRGELNELYQDYVGSVALKVSGELLQILPVDEIFVTCTSVMLNSTTGHMAPTPILSVQFTRSGMDNLKLSQIDPSDSMRNFKHVMLFKKTIGFAPITPLVDWEQ